ncbi:YbdK family carboxylate-amine ligase [Kocuria sp. cx-116]|uniref:carboxylate-amine ligase n=1 Tax=Kocuria sp. cx-116 TaxID=2771378 RepID=UPI001684456D|nr:YbdK family carboxylate-amine ligase [Kocuria sp. cx-116]MBD2761267.1 YbdK family carboxylate-amine ligase [Kocuria sp. cx-116]
MTTFGIEEEFLLVDRGTQLPATPAPQQAETLLAIDAGGGKATPEWLTCQLEHTSPVFSNAAAALDSLLSFRRELAAVAGSMGFDVAATGTAPDIALAAAQVTPGERYHRLAGMTPAIAADQYLNGMHVHIGLNTFDEGVRALNGLRPWLPLVVALGANSPVWRGSDSGFASWRSIHYRRWVANGIPPQFDDLADYRARLDALLSFDVVESPSTLAWLARISFAHGTLEVRACDVQLEAGDAVVIALLIRALVRMVLDTAVVAHMPPELLEVAAWQSAKFGLSGCLMDPATGIQKPAADVVHETFERLQPYFDGAEDRSVVRHGLERMLSNGTGAERQRRAMRDGGLSGLLAHAYSSLTAHPDLPDEFPAARC